MSKNPFTPIPATYSHAFQYNPNIPACNTPTNTHSNNQQAAIHVSRCNQNNNLPQKHNVASQPVRRLQMSLYSINKVSMSMTSYPCTT